MNACSLTHFHYLYHDLLAINITGIHIHFSLLSFSRSVSSHVQFLLIVSIMLMKTKETSNVVTANLGMIMHHHAVPIVHSNDV